MEEEARRALDIAERKLSENDYYGAKKFVNKAERLYPKLDSLKQVSTMINIYISSSEKINGEADWYGILGVDPLADDETVKKQYKKLALLLHPDKNKCKGAEGAFKLVSEAWCFLSDKTKRKSKEAETKMQKKPPSPDKPASKYPSANARSSKPANANVRNKATSNKHAPADSSKQKKGSSFWTMCNTCKTQCEYLRDYYLNKAILCPNYGHTYIAAEKTPWASFVKPVNFSSPPQQQQQWNSYTNGGSSFGRNSSPSAQKTSQESVKSQAKSTSTNGASSSEKVSSSSVSFSFSFNWNCPVSVKASSNRRNAANQAQESLKRVFFEESQEMFVAAERILKKPRTDVKT